MGVLKFPTFLIDRYGHVCIDRYAHALKFQALFVQQDARSREITDQLSQVQNELASLTKVELQKRDMKVRSWARGLDSGRG